MRLTAYLDGRRVGWFTQRDSGDVALEFDPAWQRDAGRLELSLSLPKSRRRHEGPAPGNFLWNLPNPDGGIPRGRRTRRQQCVTGRRAHGARHRPIDGPPGRDGP